MCMMNPKCELLTGSINCLSLGGCHISKMIFFQIVDFQIGSFCPIFFFFFFFFVRKVQDLLSYTFFQ